MTRRRTLSLVLVAALASAAAGAWFFTRGTDNSETGLRQRLARNTKDPAAHEMLGRMLDDRAAEAERQANAADDAAFAAIARGDLPDAEAQRTKAQDLRVDAAQIYQEAVSHYREAINARPAQMGPYNALAQVHLRRRAIVDARDTLREAVKNMPKDSPDEVLIRKSLATTLLASGEPEAAEVQLKRVLARDPAYTEAMLDLATVLATRAGWDPAAGDEAQELLDKAKTAQPSNPEIYNKAGVLAITRGKFDDAIEQLTRAVKLAPESAPYHTNLGIAYRKARRLDDALKNFRQSLKLDRRYVQAYVNIAETFRDLKHDRDAVSYLRAALAVDAENARIMGRLAEILANSPDARVNDPASSIYYAERAVEMSKESDLPLMRLLAQIYAQNQRFAEAVSTAKKAETFALRMGWQTDANDVRMALAEYRLLARRAESPVAAATDEPPQVHIDDSALKPPVGASLYIPGLPPPLTSWPVDPPRPAPASSPVTMPATAPANAPLPATSPAPAPSASSAPAEGPVH